MDSPIHVEVAIDIPSPSFWGTYTYSVPETLKGRVQPGCIVIVPFGHRRARGFVLGRSPAGPDSGLPQIKSIIRVVDPCPALSRELMDLARVMSREYCSPAQVVIRAMLPPGLRGAGKKLVRLAAGQENLEPLAGALTQEEWDVVNVLAEEGERTPSELAEATGMRNIDGVLRTLCARGIITQETVFKRPAAARVVLEVSPAREVSEGELQRITASAPRRAALLRLVLREGRPMAAAEVVRRSGAGQSSLRALEKAGLIRIDRVKRSELEGPQMGDARLRRRPVLGEGQNRAAGALLEGLSEATGRGAVCLLFGGTRESRTAVYAVVASHLSEKGRGVMLLTPEIAFTPYAGLQFAEWFGRRVAVLHSDVSEGERYERWKDIAEGRSSMVVGARSAVFAPLSDTGVIIVDEEHHDSYKQEEGNPRYHARDVALMRGAAGGAGVVLGSATPSVETYHRALSGEYRLIRMPEEDEPRRCLAVDMREEFRAGNRSIFSRVLQEELRSALARGEQAVLFLNRRGFSPFVMCRECGITLRCKDCDVTLTYHRAGIMKCHYCGREEPAPGACPRCGGRRIRPFGAGTQRVEEEARRLFPSARVIRVDFDTASRKSSYNALMRAFKERKADVLVGSQMVAGSDDLPPVALAGVMSADLILNLPDFRSAERTFQLLEEMSGAVRRHSDGVAVIQTYDGGHYSVREACNHDYEAFYRNEIEARRELGYPPFGHLVNVVIWSKSEVTARALGKEAAGRLRGGAVAGGYEVLGPGSAPFGRLRGWFRWQVVMKGPGRTAMAEAARDLSQSLDKKMRSTGSRISIDVDPVSML